jgi:hypothetical protein
MSLLKGRITWIAQNLCRSGCSGVPSCLIPHVAEWRLTRASLALQRLPSEVGG